MANENYNGILRLIKIMPKLSKEKQQCVEAFIDGVCIATEKKEEEE